MKGGSGDYTWSIGTSGQANFNYLTANKGGKIGGWTIGKNTLTGGGLTLNSGGSISGPGWSISSNGKTSGISLGSSGTTNIVIRTAGAYIAKPLTCSSP